MTATMAPMAAINAASRNLMLWLMHECLNAHRMSAPAQATTLNSPLIIPRRSE
jgi:hypothetical protein